MGEILRFVLSNIYTFLVFIDNSTSYGIGILLVGLLPIYMYVYVYRKGAFKNKVGAILSFFIYFLLSFITTTLMFLMIL
ncbi:hypothetical protein [uncultured Gammaproteobacteria bacterium]|nr:hypothetical protein [uncultured Gammaproteobacteria bacterium]CAC9983112.1 hypothetical protein [uncultured Gammaproteobacteria bacterium]